MAEEAIFRTLAMRHMELPVGDSIEVVEAFAAKDLDESVALMNAQCLS
jgi:hypothetical protein